MANYSIFCQSFEIFCQVNRAEYLILSSNNGSQKTKKPEYITDSGFLFGEVIVELQVYQP
jgi:hypothetical protein